MQAHEANVSPSTRPSVPRPAASHDAAMLAAKLDALGAQVAYLVERQKKQEELIAEMMPIAREMLATATTRLDDLEKRGYFAFGREAVRVAQRVVESYDAADVRSFGDAVVGILDTVRTLTQPEVLTMIGEAGKAMEESENAEPVGVLGAMRATGEDDVKKGMAVLLEVVRHVGAAARKKKLADLVAPKRRPARVPAPSPVRARAPEPEPAPAPAPARVPAPEPAPATAVMTDAHRALVDLARRDFEATGVSPNIRRLTQIASMSTRDVYALFPKAPARTIAQLAGIPKPAGCL